MLGMTNDEWNCSTELDKMIQLVKSQLPRKFYLFATACCRRIWDLLDPHSRRAVDMLERYADNLVSQKDLVEVYVDIPFWTGEAPKAVRLALAHPTKDHWSLPNSITDAADYACEAAAYRVDCKLREFARFAVKAGDTGPGLDAFRAERIEQCNLLRDIFHPFASFAVNPAWLSANMHAVPKLAQAIYDDRAFDRLVILTDALEDTGCTDPELLGHAQRSPSHVRGCWLVDLLLEKQ
jgi:hypothetical protein